MEILVINGPNLNMLGKRDQKKYGKKTLMTIKTQLCAIGKKSGFRLEFFQSNCEGAIIDFLQKETSRVAYGVLINPGALVRYGYCLRQALIDLNKPVVEVHMSSIGKTGISKDINILDDVRIDQIMGLKEKCYFVGLTKLISHLSNSGK